MKVKNSKKTLGTVEPFLLHEGDPHYKKVKKALEPRKLFNRGKSIKVLTKSNRGSIIRVVKKLKRKDDKMAPDKNKKNNKVNTALSIAWLVEAAFRAFAGWVLLTNFDHLVTTAAGFYALGTAGAIVITHFVRAHK